MNKYIILLSLSKLIHNLSSRGFIRIAIDLNDLLYKFIEELENEKDDEKQESNDVSSIINSVGLRGDTTPEMPWGGFTLEPFFFDSGDIRY